MKVVESIAAIRMAMKVAPRPVGLVPTMGYLHEGHLSLVRWARRNDATVVVSIFVNPTQFGPNDDFSRYPRDLARDLGMLEAEGVDFIFTPSVEEVYPPGFDTHVTVGEVGEGLEGAARPGHFRGVATVVAKLFNIVGPDRAYFGQKDAQQVAVIRKLVADLNLPVEIVPMPIVREPDGLALSSRNVYLSPEERRAATVISRSLRAAASAYEAGERDAERLRQMVHDILASEPLARPEYVSVADATTLHELDCVDRPALVSLAVRIGKTRLIDNMVVGLTP